MNKMTDDKDLTEHQSLDNLNIETLIADKLTSTCYVVDIDTYEIMYINDTLKKIYDIENKDHKNIKCHKFFKDIDEPCAFCKKNKIKEDEEYVWEYYDQKLDSDFIAKDTLILHNGRRFKMSITDQASSQFTLLNKKDAIQDAVNKCITITFSENDTELKLHQILEVMRDFYKSERIAIFEFNDSKQSFSCSYVLGFDGFTKNRIGLQEIPSSVIANWFPKFENDGHIIIDSVTDSLDPQGADFKILKVFDVKNLLTTPIKKNNNLTGFVLSASATINKCNIEFLEITSLFIKDCLEKIKTQNYLENLLNYDRLTGLYNRHYFDLTINKIKEQHINNTGIVYIDINGLKKMNDNFGHSYGDCYIENCVKIINKHFPNCAYRIGGDEFVVITNENNETTFNQIVNAFEIDIKKSKKVSMSFGIAWCESSVNINNSIKIADALMYENKQNYYKNIEDVEEFFARNVIDTLQKSVEEQQLKILYQPKIDLDTKACIGAEAFLYKVYENGDFVPSSVFIAEYESLGNMYLLDLYMLERCCMFLNDLDENLKQTISLSMKFSTQTILVKDIHIECKEICEKLNIHPSKITIEVNEESVINDSKEFMDKLQLFRQLGFKLSIENFGITSNKKELIENNFDKVKLNKQLLVDVKRNETKYAVLDHLIKNYQSISNLDIIVNGVEEQEHIEFLNSYKGLIGQGDLFSKQLLRIDFLSYLQKQ